MDKTDIKTSPISAMASSLVPPFSGTLALLSLDPQPLDFPARRSVSCLARLVLSVFG